MNPAHPEFPSGNVGSRLAGGPSFTPRTVRRQAPTLQVLNWLPVFAVLAFVAVVLLAGCCSVPAADEEPIAASVRPEPPRPATVNHVGVNRLPPEVRRVVLLPVSGGSLVTPEAAAALDPVFAEALQRKLRFEVVPVSRDWCRRYFGARDFSSAAALPYDFLARLGADHAADAVLFVDVTAYRDHRPLTLGLRAKLATIAGPRLLWSYDEILTTDDAALAASALEHARANARAGLPVDLSPGVLQSPSRFAAFAADTVFSTLPPR
jgi:hypothetical protein